MKKKSCFFKKTAAALLIALFVCALSSRSLVGFCDVNQKIDAAQTAIREAFKAVSEAERAGARAPAID